MGKPSQYQRKEKYGRIFFNLTEEEIRAAPEESLGITLTYTDEGKVNIAFNLIEELNETNIEDSYIYNYPEFEVTISKEQLPKFIAALQKFSAS